MSSHRIEVVVRGHLGSPLVPAMEPLAVTRRDDGTTLLTGTVRDHPELLGLLATLADLHVDVLSVTVDEGAHR